MSNVPSPSSWRQKAFQAVVLLMVIALAARVVAEVLEPLVPVLVVVTLLGAIAWFVIARRR